MAAVEQSAEICNRSYIRAFSASFAISIGLEVIMAKFKTLEFPSTPKGQKQKIAALNEHAALGWHVVSETVSPGHFKTGEAACGACGGMLCCGPLGAPLGLLAGRTQDKIIVTLQKNGNINSDISKRGKIV
jgi:hypothetical protein